MRIFDWNKKPTPTYTKPNIKSNIKQNAKNVPIPNRKTNTSQKIYMQESEGSTISPIKQAENK